MKPLYLNEHERGQDGVKKTVAHFKERLEELRSSLERDITEEASAKIRGRIQEIRDFLRAVEPQNLDIRPVAHRVIE